MKRVLKPTWVRSLALLILLMSAAQVSLGTTVTLPSDDEMLIAARAIVRGKVLSVGTRMDEQNRIYTYITLKVQEVLKGQITERKIVIKEEGGEFGDRGTLIFGAPQFTRGEKVLVYLDTRTDGSLRVHQMFLGKFSIINDEQTGKEMVVRHAPDQNIQILPPHEHPGQTRGPSTNRMELSAYTAMIRSRLEVNWAAAVKFEEEYYAGVPVLAQPVEYEEASRGGGIQPQFTLIHSSKPRWFEPDSGQPVLFHVNPTGAPSAQTLDDVNAAMNAWSVIPGCSLRLANGGTTGNCTPSSNQNTIVFNNCDGRWSGGGCQGVLALGGLSWTGETTVINGTVFRRATMGFISFNPFASCNFGNNCNVREITTHELGHAIGLGHSEIFDATMWSIAHFDGRCASVRTDDVNGALFMYPAGAGGGGPLSIVTTTLTGGLVGAPYTSVLIASGGTAPYSWSLVSGSGSLPPGLSLGSNGTITGTPTTVGSYNFTVRVTDNTSATAQKALSINVVSGSTALSSQFVSQTVPTTVNPGQSFTVNLRWLNTGAETWSNGFRVVSQNPPQNNIWGGTNVPLGGLFSIPQGQTLDLNFTVFAPSAPGTYNFQWQMWKDGPGFFGQMSTNIAIQVGSGSGGGGTNNSTFVSQSVPGSMTAGQSQSVTVTMRNTGTTTWTTGSYKLGSQNPQDNTTWGLSRVSLSSSVAPNNDATFTFNVTAPSTAGTHNFQWRMIQEGTGFFGASSTNVAVQVTSSGGGSTKLEGTTFGTSPSFTAGREFDKAHDGNTSSFFDFMGANGGFTGLDLGPANAKRVVKIRYFARSDWPGGPARMIGGKFQGSNSSTTTGFVDLHTVTVAPGLSGWVEVTISDATEYRYLRYLSPDGGFCNVAEVEFYGPAGSGGGGTDDAAFVSQTVSPTMTTGQISSVTVTMRNSGTSTWTTGNGYKLGSQNPQDNTTWGLNRVSLPHPVSPGNEATFVFNITAPSAAGSYNFQWRLFKEGSGFFGQLSTNVVVQVTSSGLTKLTGTAFGTSPSFTAGREFDKAHDGNTSSFFDFMGANGGFTGLDLGPANAKRVVKIRYFARSDWPGGPARMIGGKFQGSNSSTTTGFVDLHTVTVAPGLSGWVEVTISDATEYRYLRYLSPDGGFCNVAEVEFYTGTAATGKLAGTAFGTSPSFTAGREFDKAHDGNTSSFFDFMGANGGFTGLDLGPANAKRVVKIRYFARSDWPGGPARMIGGKFQGSNSSTTTGFVDLHTITVAPALGGWVEVTITDPTAFRYLRFLSPDGGFCNVAEVEFYDQ